MTFLQGLKALYPRPMAVSLSERVRGAIGGGLGIAIAGFICLWIATRLGLSPWLVAPLGASAVLVFAVPSSPLAQPWSVVGGNTVSALVGLLVCNLVPDPPLAAALAVAGAIGAMFALRCLHPPGGAMALLVVLTHTQHPLFALFPALTNSLLLVAVGLVYNNLTRKAYPHVAPATTAQKSGLVRIREDDLAAALDQYNEVLPIAADDLARLLEISELHAWRRMAGHHTCADVMTAPVLSVHFGTHLKEAWALLESHDIKALPIVDRRRRPHGLLTHDDFMRHAALIDPENPDAGLKRLITPSGHSHSEIPEVAGQIMRDDYVTARTDTPLNEIMPLFRKGDKRHVLVVDGDRRLAGIISSSDMMRALFHAAA